MKLNVWNIQDLTTPRYVERIFVRNGHKCKSIVDTHCMLETRIAPYFTMDTDLTENIDELNTDYHNYVAAFLGFDVTLGSILTNINRSAW